VCFVPPLPLPEALGDDLVRLRPFQREDAAEVYEACLDPLIVRFTTFPTAQDVDAARGWILSQTGQRERGEALDMAICATANGALLGAVGLAGLDAEHRRAEAGYWLAPGARGHGFAARALALFADWAFGPPLELVRIGLSIDVDNVASQRTAECAGFAREGVLRSFIEAKGRRWDVAIYSRLAPAQRPPSEDRRIRQGSLGGSDAELPL
jgi:RimJ/RimL family protein N-acetyltransferase